MAASVGGPEVPTISWAREVIAAWHLSHTLTPELPKVRRSTSGVPAGLGVPISPPNSSFLRFNGAVFIPVEVVAGMRVWTAVVAVEVARVGVRV